MAKENDSVPDGVETILTADKIVGYQINGQKGIWKRIAASRRSDYRTVKRALYNAGTSLGWFVKMDAEPIVQQPLFDVAADSDEADAAE